MKYNPNQRLLSMALGLAPARAKELNALFYAALRALPKTFQEREVHTLVAPFLQTPEEAYFMATMVRAKLENAGNPEPQFHAN